MNAAFSKNLILLRKERGLSQKKVAEDLNISQALLSHYEKGIRECGLDFVIGAAEYFGVSSDFLLGRTDRRDSHRRGEKSSRSRESGVADAMYIVFAILKKINNKSLTREATYYLSGAVYTIFRAICGAGESDTDGLFTLEEELYPVLTSSRMSLALAKCCALLRGAEPQGEEPVVKEDIPKLTPELLAEEYPRLSSALFELIETTEKQGSPFGAEPAP